MIFVLGCKKEIRQLFRFIFRKITDFLSSMGILDPYLIYFFEKLFMKQPTPSNIENLRKEFLDYFRNLDSYRFGWVPFLCCGASSDSYRQKLANTIRCGGILYDPESTLSIAVNCASKIFDAYKNNPTQIPNSEWEILHAVLSKFPSMDVSGKRDALANDIERHNNIPSIRMVYQEISKLTPIILDGGDLMSLEQECCQKLKQLMEKEYNEAENGRIPPWNKDVFTLVAGCTKDSTIRSNPVKLLVDISNALLSNNDDGTLHEE
jgi:hypothetical protein